MAKGTLLPLNVTTGNSFHNMLFTTINFINAYFYEKHLRIHNSPNLEMDRLQQQKTTWGSSLVSQEEQESHPAVGKDWVFELQ